MSASNDEPEKKKLRSSECDLRVSLGSGDEQAVLRYHAVILASRSKYIDTMLATPMKEGREKEISFPDILPELWDKMMKYLEDPKAIRKMTVKDAMEVLKMYDKYDFQEGRELCDDVLKEYFESTRTNEKKEPPDVDTLIDGIVLAHDANLETAYQTGREYIVSKLEAVSVPYGRTMFTEEHLTKLVPLLLEDEEELHPNLWGWSKEQIKAPDWPKRCVERWSTKLMRYTLEGFVHHIEVSGTNCDADGIYMPGIGGDEYLRDRTIRWGTGSSQTLVKTSVERMDKGWAIVRETLPTEGENGQRDMDSTVSTICWLNPCSVNLPLPPQSGYKEVDTFTNNIANPKIRYVLHPHGTMKDSYI